MVSVEAYSVAKEFLFNVSVEKIVTSLSYLKPFYGAGLGLSLISESLELIKKETADEPTRLGDILLSLEAINRNKFDEKSHRFLHLFRDFFTSHEASFFYSLAASQLGKSGEVLSVMDIACLSRILKDIPYLDLDDRIDSFEVELCYFMKNEPEQLEEIEALKKKISFYKLYRRKGSFLAVYELLLYPKRHKETLRGIYDDYLPERAETVLSRAEDDTYPYWVKVFSSSTKYQREDWQKYLIERGVQNYMDALEPAVEKFSSMSIAEFRDVIPNFVKHFQHKLPRNLDLVDQKMTLRDYLKELEVETSKYLVIEFVKTFVGSLERSFSASLEVLIKNSESLSRDEFYKLWEMAKCVIDEKVFFTL